MTLSKARLCNGNDRGLSAVLRNRDSCLFVKSEAATADRWFKHFPDDFSKIVLGVAGVSNRRRARTFRYGGDIDIVDGVLSLVSLTAMLRFDKGLGLSHASSSSSANFNFLGRIVVQTGGEEDGEHISTVPPLLFCCERNAIFWEKGFLLLSILLLACNLSIPLLILIETI